MKLADEAKLNSLMRPKQIMLMSTPFTADNGFLTPTFKMKRNVAKDLLKNEIKALYELPLLKPTSMMKSLFVKK